MKMWNLPPGAHVHFVGICGTAMGNVAVGMQEKGFAVTGSDSGVYPPMSEVLKEKGIGIRPFEASNTRKPDLFVIGNAIPRGNVEVEEILNRRKPFCSLPQLLRDEFVEDRKLILVTGTHGKTTTTALIFHILKENGFNPSCMIGGVPLGEKSGFFWSPESKLFVMEGDEYDTAFFDKTSKFLKFSPDFLIINAIEFDHADIFSSIGEIERAFQFLLRRTPANSLVVANGDEKRVLSLKQFSYSRFTSFGFGRENPNRVELSGYSSGKMELGLHLDHESFSLFSRLPGRHNAMNIAAACTVCMALDVSAVQMARSVESFPGVRRRFELRALNSVSGIRLIEDFAHHPTAVATTIRGARSMFPGSRILAFFEPASNTMRRGALRRELLQSLELADLAFLLPIPESRRELAKNFNSIPAGKLSDNVRGLSRQADIPSLVRSILQKDDVVLFMSNGTGQGILEELTETINTFSIAGDK
ncbi:MAG: UDP-N-acetylmuramate:L-alanyl-gamma-D-glutamyl-meso-diaminopimelate ligase [Acidobacteria bacterium]|nr:UDP-N-acetylmuramate:L-alanyl-gamma-D-glutamyl-meso-diaminopimelate ligase [Acidobacteriota bacterium]